MLATTPSRNGVTMIHPNMTRLLSGSFATTESPVAKSQTKPYRIHVTQVTRDIVEPGRLGNRDLQ